MIRTLFWALLILGASWLVFMAGQYPAVLRLDLPHHTVETSLGFVTMIGVLAFFILFFGASFLGRILSWFNPARKLSRRQMKGVDHLTLALVDLSAGQNEAAAKHAQKASRFMKGHEGLSLFFEAQAAQNAGAHDKAQILWQRLSRQKGVEFLGLKGLLQQAIKEGDKVKALALATDAHQHYPEAKGLTVNLLSLQAQNGLWIEAQETLQMAKRKGAITRSERRKSEAMIFAHRARIALKRNAYDEAYSLCKEALSYDPAFVPATIMMAKMIFENGRPRRARGLVEKAWRYGPHRDLADCYSALIEKESPQDQIKFCQRLIAAHPDETEGQLLLAKRALHLDQTVLAEEALDRLEKINMNDRHYVELRLLLCEKQNRGAEDKESWRARLENASQMGWCCAACGHSHAEWEILCESCHAFGSLTWQKTGEASASLTVFQGADDNLHLVA